MPLKLAVSEKSRKYNDIVDKEILKYLELKLPHNLFDPAKGHNLDITVKQLRQMLNAPNKCFEVASSGELKQILNNFHTAEAKSNETRDKVEASIDEASHKLDVYINETWQMYKESKIEKSCSFYDYVPFVGRSKLQIMIEDMSLWSEIILNYNDIEIFMHYWKCWYIIIITSIFWFPKKRRYAFLIFSFGYLAADSITWANCLLALWAEKKK